jgi:hypothetical protein
LKALDGFIQARAGVEDCARSQHEGSRKGASRLRRCGNPFVSQAEIVNGTVWVAGRILDSARAQPTSPRLGRKTDCSRHDFGRVPEALFQIRGNGQIRRLGAQERVRQPLISRQPAISSA